MRKILFATAAAAVLFAAGAASAGNDSTSVQIGKNLQLNANTELNHAGIGGALTGTATVVANSISLSSPASFTAPNADTAFASAQDGRYNVLNAKVDVSNFGAGTTKLSTQAFNNNGSFESLNGKLTEKSWQEGTTLGSGIYTAGASWYAGAYKEAMAFQNGEHSQLNASTIARDFGSNGAFEATATAVNNSLSFTAKANTSAVAYQLGDHSTLNARVEVSSASFGGATLSSTAINNIASWTSISGAADGINYQSGSHVNSNALTKVQNVGVNGGLTIGALAAGNIANIKTGL